MIGDLYILKEYISLNTGFLTFGMWVVVAIVKGIVGLMYGYSGIKMKIFVLTAMAATPVIWIRGNKKIWTTLRSRFSSSELSN